MTHPPQEVAQALVHLRGLCEFAYQQGFHELGYDPVATVSAALADKAGEPRKLWLWRNHVDGRPEYWAFDHPFPKNMDDADPQTIGEPCGYAIVKPCRPGRSDWTEESVLRAIAGAAEHERRRTSPPGAPAPGWQPIESCLMDGADVLLFWRDWQDRDVVEVGPYCRHGSGGARSLHGQATHWQPLPSPPASAPKEMTNG